MLIGGEPAEALRRGEFAPRERNAAAQEGYVRCLLPQAMDLGEPCDRLDLRLVARDGREAEHVQAQLRDELGAGADPDAARFLTAGRGLAPLAEVSAANMHHATYVVTTVEGARADVEELAVRKVPIIKMWVDTRGGTMKTLTPDLYGAILDEAHKRRVARPGAKVE